MWREFLHFCLCIFAPCFQVLNEHFQYFFWESLPRPGLVRVSMLFVLAGQLANACSPEPSFAALMPSSPRRTPSAFRIILRQVSLSVAA